MNRSISDPANLPLAEATGRDTSDLEAVDRAVAELRRGGAVVVTDGGEGALIRAAETVDIWPLPFFDGSGLGVRRLIVTGRRAAILGLGQVGAVAVELFSKDEFTPEHIRPLIDPQAEGRPVPPQGITAVIAPQHGIAASAIRLGKIARLLPAIVMAPLTEEPVAWARASGRLIVDCHAIMAYDRMQAGDLRAVSEARVPLAACADARIVSFRPRDGGAEHLAIVIGQPDPNKPVLTRLHSECFTGDLIGSLRCDCGEQLRGAIAMIAEAGNGVLLYLAQEGRGIGLVNKLRAYALQDQGFDTLDANEQLGFDDDERVYLPAVRMLRVLGFTAVRLLTNNPAKVGALARHGIEVAERVPHVFPSNEHNWTYLQTKAKRSGHLL
ncbi:MAG: GTP cyclohydrolase II [Rhodospirillaceae bacterium]|nr:MAG: GTP cyclohydrolase II [Rhodospirillaceae bacterium]